MTLAEAIEKAREETLVTRATIGHHVAGQSPVNLQDVVVALEALGLIKFEEPKTEDDLLTDALRAAWWAAGQKNATHGPLAINKVLLDAGFKIVRA